MAIIRDDSGREQNLRMRARSSSTKLAGQRMPSSARLLLAGINANWWFQPPTKITYIYMIIYVYVCVKVIGDHPAIPMAENICKLKPNLQICIWKRCVSQPPAIQPSHQMTPLGKRCACRALQWTFWDPFKVFEYHMRSRMILGASLSHLQPISAIFGRVGANQSTLTAGEKKQQ